MEQADPRVWEVTDYSAAGVRAEEIVRTSAYAVTVLRYAPGGLLGRHPAGWPQRFTVVEGSGWAAGADGERTPLTAGQGVRWAAGEEHESGTDAGMTVVVVQAESLPGA